MTNVDGTGVRQLTPDGMLLDDSGFGGSWAPSGDDVLFVARETDEHHKAIWIVNADEGSPQQLAITQRAAVRSFGSLSWWWSPSGDVRRAFTVTTRWCGAIESKQTARRETSSRVPSHGALGLAGCVVCDV